MNSYDYQNRLNALVTALNEIRTTFNHVLSQCEDLAFEELGRIPESKEEFSSSSGRTESQTADCVAHSR